MAKVMTAALTIPHFGYSDEIVLNELVRYSVHSSCCCDLVWGREVGICIFRSANGRGLSFLIGLSSTCKEEFII